MKTSHQVLAAIIVAISSSTVSAVHAQDDRSSDLLKSLDPAAAISGVWSLLEGELTVQSGSPARLAISTGVPDRYRIVVEFTRTEGDDTVGLILPVGDVSPALELSAWQGTAHGLSRVDGNSAKEEANPTSVQPGTLENGRRYRLEVSVDATANPASVKAVLDGKKLFDWKGAVSSLEPNLVVNLPTPRTLGLATQRSGAVFHQIEIEAAGVQAPSLMPMKNSPAATASRGTPTSGVPRPKDGSVDLVKLGQAGTPGWEPFNGAEFETSEFDGLVIATARPEAGSADRGAYLDDIDFSEGTIEIDLKGSTQPQGSFLGVVFHGFDGKTYDSVYFRPFNFNGPRSNNAVQYMSHPDFPWDQLRRDNSGEFEAAAAPSPDGADWFSAKVLVADGRVRVFIDGATKPCLDVEKLGDTSGGKVGLWFNGVASFANLRISPEG